MKKTKKVEQRSIRQKIGVKKRKINKIVISLQRLKELTNHQQEQQEEKEGRNYQY